jgi:small subunit ribosomal protein S19
MSKRSLWKGPFLDSSLINLVKKAKSSSKFLNTTSRTSIILPFLIGKTLRIHNGKNFILLKITDEMVGFKLGEFIPTRVRHLYRLK